jgi:hypothetical protein
METLRRPTTEPRPASSFAAGRTTLACTSVKMPIMVIPWKDIIAFCTSVSVVHGQQFTVDRSF